MDIHKNARLTVHGRARPLVNVMPAFSSTLRISRDGELWQDCRSCLRRTRSRTHQKTR